VFVCNGTRGDYFGRSTATSSRTPMTLEIARGAPWASTATRRARARVRRYCHTDEFSDRVGELRFGTNLALSEMIGILLQDEKVPGVHLAFGDPYGSQTGAPWKSRRTSTSCTRAATSGSTTTR
jgi:leucyl aminopeptidase (aminopeptidase T)